MKALFDAAERLNRANVAQAQATGERLYRDAMTPEARALDEAFQAHYEARHGDTNGPRPLPPTSERVEIDAATIGMSLKMSDETRQQIEEIERNQIMAARNARNFVCD